MFPLTSQSCRLTKEEVRTFIHRALNEGIFSEFFTLQEKKEQAAVDALFDEIFLDAFIDDAENNVIDKKKYNLVVRAQIQDDIEL